MLKGQVALVTGGSRGVGKGIAQELRAQGTTVYVTGRTVAEQGFRDGSVPIACDHTRDDQVALVFRRILDEQGRLDVLVNNVWGGYENMERFGRPFWEQPIWRWEAMFDRGARAHLVASQLAVPLMLARRRGLIVSTSVAWPADRYDGRLVYYLAKETVNRLAWAMAQELRPHNIAAVAVSPVGVKDAWVASGAELQSIYDALATPGGIEALRRANPREENAQTPEYIGRAVAMLAADPRVMAKTGQVLKVSDLAAEYGFTDVDGRRPPHD
jgi:NAD(P)-dependent dehydrogenase (short-subunit alcohol dehydrogenase family)